MRWKEKLIQNSQLCQENEGLNTSPLEVTFQWIKINILKGEQDTHRNAFRIILSNTRDFPLCQGLSVFVQCLKLLLSSGPSHYGNNETNNSSSRAVYVNDHVLKQEQATYCWERWREKKKKRQS